MPPSDDTATKTTQINNYVQDCSVYPTMINGIIQLNNLVTHTGLESNVLQ